MPPAPVCSHSRPWGAGGQPWRNHGIGWSRPIDMMYKHAATSAHWLICAAVVGLLALTSAACGANSPHSSPGQHEASALCKHAGLVTQLLDRRQVIATQGTHPRFTFPTRVIVTDSAVPQVAATLCATASAPPASTTCAMPAPTGHSCDATPASPEHISVYCPVAIPVSYHLTFWAGQQRYPTVTVSTAMCPWPQLWSALGRAMNLPRATLTTFTGGVSGGLAWHGPAGPIT
jgi:hypothetical protein